MKCFLCGAKGAIKQQKGRDICNKCFSRLLEKRVRKFSRVNKLFRRGDRILVLGDVNKFFVSSIIGDRPVKLFFRKKEDKEFVKKNRVNKIVVEWTMDDEAAEFVEALFSGKKVKKADGKHVKLLKTLTDKEVEIFAKINKLKFKARKKDKLSKEFLDNVEKKHPSIKYNLLRNIGQLKHMLNRLTD